MVADQGMHAVFCTLPMQLRKAREQMRGYPIAADGAGLEGVPQ